MLGKVKIGAVILAYDVDPFIARVIGELPDIVDKVYVVDDCSRDSTARIVSEMQDPRVSLIRHAVNQGPGGALKTGYRAAMRDDIDVIVKLDGDGQMPSDRIVDLVLPIANRQADYTKGNRFANNPREHGMPPIRFFGNYMLTWMTRIASGYWHVSDTQNGFTAISTKALMTIGVDFYPYYGYLNDILVRLNACKFNVIDIGMNAQYGTEKSKIKYLRFIPKVSLLLIRCWLWRMRKKAFEAIRLIPHPSLENQPATDDS